MRLHLDGSSSAWQAVIKITSIFHLSGVEMSLVPEAQGPAWRGIVMIRVEALLTGRWRVPWEQIRDLQPWALAIKREAVQKGPACSCAAVWILTRMLTTV